MARYIPPARRQQLAFTAAASEQKPHDGAVLLEEIDNHFWPVSSDVSPPTWITRRAQTLHYSAATPGKLAYLLLFQGANPRWETDRIVFTKSSLELLPAALADGQSEKYFSDSGRAATRPIAGDEAERTEEVALKEGESEEQRPIAVFKQVPNSQQHVQSFRFAGWFQIERLAFLEARSPELVQMLEQKWSRVDSRGNVRQEKRDHAKWSQSLDHRWAVLKLKRDEVAAKEHGHPRIERLDDTFRHAGGGRKMKKSVNEMLAELRTSDSKTSSSSSSAATALRGGT